MCGIVGLIDWRAATSADALRATGEAMIETVRPDGQRRAAAGKIGALALSASAP
jgi:hypothetical protein